MWRFVRLAFVGTMLLVATSTVAAAGTSPNTAPMATAKVKAAGVSLKYPRSWVSVPLTKKELAAQAKILSKKNPKLAAAMAGTDVSQFKFRAFDPSADSGQNVGVQLIEGQGAPSSLSEFKSGVGPGYRAAGATVVDATAVKVSGKTAYRIDVTLPIKLPDGSADVARVGQLVIPQGDKVTAVNAVASNNEAGAALIDSILNSVRRV